MKLFVLASCALGASATAPPNKVMLFKSFMDKYDRSYATEFEQGQRFQTFSENIDMIYTSNAQNRSFTLGITANADQTFQEWRSSHLHGITPPLTATRNRVRFSAPEDFAEPDSVDWVAKGGVTSVKTQGTCGSCWTISTVGALEGAMFVAGRKIQDLSMQHILSCDTGGHGCKGGYMEQAFGWVTENGVPALADEPYLCKDATSSECTSMSCGGCQSLTGESCTFGGCKVANSVCNKDGFIHHCECPAGQCFTNGKCSTNTHKVPSLVIAKGDVTTHTDVAQTEGALEAAVAQQPVSVLLDADHPAFAHYTGGILTSDACGKTLDHGVLVVGYGVENGQKYWKVKNSWGPSFGEDGYIRIEKGKGFAASGGECGIRKAAVFPTLKKADATVVV